ncbi:hypothetical protein COLO4_07546 [Corchorus olitorius]|uniref:Uncharacterized protein n=1 Tax=Corchorus olitorius TaxID=93759 RepID=A0A1R3KJN0_9ROSI|nr:hypothetical protein COLO4_07546 [Corchorus olitorius]
METWQMDREWTFVGHLASANISAGFNNARKCISLL